MESKKTYEITEKKATESQSNKNLSLGEKAKKYFSESHTKDGDPLKIFYKCKLCSGEKNGTKDCNLASHLAHSHLEYYNAIQSKNKDPMIIK